MDYKRMGYRRHPYEVRGVGGRFVRRGTLVAHENRGVGTGAIVLTLSWEPGSKDRTSEQAIRQYKDRTWGQAIRGYCFVWP